MRERPSGVGDERAQNIPLDRREPNRGAAPRDATVDQIDREPVRLDHRRDIVGRGQARPPQQGAHPCHEFRRAERLGDVIIRSRIEQLHLLGVRMPGGQHEDRHPGPRPDLTAHVHSSEVRQPQVQDDEVRTLRRRDINAFSSGRGLEQPIRHVAERVAQRAPNRRVIFDDQQRPGADGCGRRVVAQACAPAKSYRIQCERRGATQGPPPSL